MQIYTFYVRNFLRLSGEYGYFLFRTAFSLNQSHVMPCIQYFAEKIRIQKTFQTSFMELITG